MNKEFRMQILVSVIIILVFNILNTVFRHWFFTSIGFCSCGLLWFIRPLKRNDYRPEEDQFKECKIAGVVLFFLGLFLRANFYS